MILRPFFAEHEDRIAWDRLSRNPNAGELLMENVESIDWEQFFQNPRADDIFKDLLKDLPDMPSFEDINLMDPYAFEELSKNPGGSEILKMCPEMINIDYLALNPKIIEILDGTDVSKIEDTLGGPFNRKDMLDLEWICKNPSQDVVEMLKENKRKINWGDLSENTNPDAINMILDKIELDNNNAKNMFDENYLYYSTDEEEEYRMNVCWGNIAANPSAGKIIEAYEDEVYWRYASSNTNPNILSVLYRRHRSKIDWRDLSANPSAMEILKENPSNIVWYVLSSNPSAIEYLKENPSESDWRELCKNPNPKAIELLENKPDEIDWFHIWENPGIFMPEPRCKPTKSANKRIYR